MAVNCLRPMLRSRTSPVGHERCHTRLVGDDRHFADHVAFAAPSYFGAVTGDDNRTGDDDVHVVPGLSFGSDGVAVAVGMLLCHLGDPLELLRSETGEQRDLAEEQDPLHQTEGGQGPCHLISRGRGELDASSDPTVMMVQQLGNRQRAFQDVSVPSSTEIERTKQPGLV